MEIVGLTNKTSESKLQNSMLADNHSLLDVQ